jgi:hypothetical protein
MEYHPPAGRRKFVSVVFLLQNNKHKVYLANIKTLITQLLNAVRKAVPNDIVVVISVDRKSGSRYIQAICTAFFASCIRPDREHCAMQQVVTGGFNQQAN